VVYETDAAPWVRAQYAEVRDLVHDKAVASQS
jgi:hypothetical protein